MKIFSRFLEGAAIFCLMLIVSEPTATCAATTPSLGAAAAYGALAGTYINTSAATTITGSVGFTTGPAQAPLGVHPSYGSGVPTPTARVDAANALSVDLATQPCTYTFPDTGTAIDLSTDLNHGPVYTPGVYCTAATRAASIGAGGITLNGAGTYIFRIEGALTTADNSSITLIGASPCDVFWTPIAATTLGASTTFAGTIIDNATAINVGANTVWTGRALSLGAGTVTTGDTSTITAPTCTPATLHIIKSVINNSGGSATASAFNLHVKLAGTDVSGSPAVGVVSPGTAYTLAAGTYVVSEDANASYAQSFSGDCDASGNITLAAGTDKTCTITNDDIAPPPPLPATLHIIKTVINNSGGSATASSFNLHVKLAGTDVSGSPAVGVVSPGTAYTLAAGTYVVSEDANASYAQSFSGDCDASGNITLIAGADKTCTVTNDDIVVPPPISTINVVKIVINDNGRTKVIADFPLFVNGTPVVSGVTNAFAAPAAYTVTEISDPNYTQTFSGDCDASGHISLLAGQSKFCIITNNDIPFISNSGSSTNGSPAYVAPVAVPPIPPLIDVVKVPDPLALPDGPGLVTYTYTLHNIGTVPVTDITMVGDTCKPITLISGDVNHDMKLDVGETWIYRCSTMLSQTHTNTVVATGWANGLSATDITSATVIVGAPIVPPLIHVTKVPNPLTLLAGGGTVIYTEKVTNPGTVALSNVHLADDKCSSIKYVSGDLNQNNRLDPDETFIFTCRSELAKTTTGTAVAIGEANGITARDIAIATVVVADLMPKLPHAGLAPENNSVARNIAIISGVIVLVSISLSVTLRKRKI